MNKDKYLNELRKELKRIESKKREEIIKEIESSMEEFDSYDSLIHKFGTPKELAQNYLEILPQNSLLSEKAISSSKKILMFLGLSVLIFIIAIVIFINYYTKDEFDYSKYNSQNINDKVDGIWIKSKEEIQNISIEQSKAVFYWSEGNKIEYNCKGRKTEILNNSMDIRQSICYIKLPKQKLQFNIRQSAIVFVKPNQKFKLNTEQSELRFAYSEEKYNFKVILNDSDIKNLKSDDNGILIDGKVIESSLEKYKY